MKNNYMTIIYGASDDLIEMEGDIHDEHGQYEFKGTISCSDGTKLHLEYTGTWDFTIKESGSLFKSIVSNVGENDQHSDPDILKVEKHASSYSDVIVFNDGLEWIKIGRKTYKP